MTTEARYLTDDRDLPPDELKELVIFQGGNGDYYVQIAPAGGRTMEGVRLCTSGGASFAAPGLTQGISMAYRAMVAAQNGDRLFDAPSYYDLEREVAAWRDRARKYEFDPRSGEIVLRVEG